MSSQAKTLRSKRLVPSLQRADAAGIFIESFTLLNTSQPGELGMQGMVGRQKKLFAVQDRRIAVAAVVSEPDLKGLQVNGRAESTASTRRSTESGTGGSTSVASGAAATSRSG